MARNNRTHISNFKTIQPKIGRPSIKTDAVLNEFLDRIMLGESMRKICDTEHMPEVKTICRWLRDDDNFCQQYARARTVQADMMVEGSIAIADAAQDRTEAEIAKVRIQARQWAASKLNPKKYGDKIAIDHSGKIETAPPSWVSNSGESL